MKTRHVILSELYIRSSWLRTDKPETLNEKSLSQATDSVVGPSSSGKTQLIFKMLASPTTFKPTLGNIYFFRKEYHSLFKEIQDKIKDIELLPCSKFQMIKNTKNCLLVFDDSCEEIYQKKFVKLAVSGRHKKVNYIFVKHNFFIRASGHAQFISTRPI